MAARRAIVCYLDENPHLVQQLLALRLSCFHSEIVDTDIVVFGPESVLVGLPDDLVTIPQPRASDEPIWRDYKYINSITCLNGVGSERLEAYSHLLRTDVDTFMTPAWNDFAPDHLVTGRGGYSNSDEIKQRLIGLAGEYRLTHRGVSSIGSTWYGPTGDIRRACAISEMIAKRLLNHHFADDPGAWPGWYRGVVSLYSGEIAINHCAPDAELSPLLDAWSTSDESPTSVVHIHCWHTSTRFSKHAFMSRKYDPTTETDLDPDRISDYCLALSFQSLIGLDLWKEAQAAAKSAVSEA